MEAGAKSARLPVFLLVAGLGAAFLMAGLFVVWFVVLRIPASGIELWYRIAVPDADRTEMATAVRRRLELLEIRGAEVRIGSDFVNVRLPGATPETATRVKGLLRNVGRLQLCPAAPIDVQEKFNSSQVVPEGYQVVHNPDGQRGSEYDAYATRVLVRKDPILEGRHVAHAEAREETASGGARWVTAFEMTPEGARLFDEAAEKLSRMRPPGLLAILFDGAVKSIPVVQGASFQGHAQISGAKDKDDAADLAIMMMSGELPVPLGEAYAERRYGK